MNKILLSALGLASLLATSTGIAGGNIKGLAATCNGCHGENGVSAGDSMPSIGGQNEAYLKSVMMEWKTGERFSTTMGRLIKGYSDEEISALAKFYAEKPWVPVAQDLKPKMVKEGKFAFDRCAKCHGDTGGTPDDEDTPKLNGQWAKFLDLEMQKWRNKDVKLSHEKMRKTSTKLAEDELAAVTQFLAAQQK